MSTSRRYVDLSHSLSPATAAFPGDPPLEIHVFDSTASPSVGGERHLNSSHLSMSLHCGTHMDAPFHFFGAAAPIDRVLLEHCIGPACLVRVPWQEQGPTIEARHLAGSEATARRSGRVILNTDWHKRWGSEDYFTAHPVISQAAAELLVAWGVVLVGVDTPSVDRAPFPAHLALLGAGTLIVENLTNLDAIGATEFELIATPLKILGRDGSPVRAVALVD